MMQHVLLWGLGALFLGLAPLVKHENGIMAARCAQFAFIFIGALCVRFA